jgi:hypothetical protein
MVSERIGRVKLFPPLKKEVIVLTAVVPTALWIPAIAVAKADPAE